MILKNQLNALKALTPKCLVCNSIVESSLNNLISGNTQICHTCFNNMKPVIKKVKIAGVKGLLLYSYNEFSRNIILQIKANYDLELAKYILAPLKPFLREKYAKYALVPIPSTNSSNKARGFNHVEVIFSLLGLPILNLFEKVGNYKQANIKFEDRNQISNNIKLISNVEIPSKIVVIDDIITSGSSLRSLLYELKSKGVKNLTFIILADNCRKIKLNKDLIKTKW
jgi:predicted amidophosphoribosyltransferase